MSEKKVETRPSSSGRWSKCEASAVLETQAEAEREASAAAIRGTKLHDEAYNFALHKPGNYDADSVRAVEIANALISDFLDTKESLGEVTQLMEFKLEAEGYELLAGTADRLVVAGQVAFLLDYKFGSIYVDNDRDNTQLLIYSGHIAKLFPQVTKVFAVIIQPARNDFPSPFVFDRETLLAEFDALNQIAQSIHRWNGETELSFEVGDHCRYCKAKPICKEYMKSIGMNELVQISSTAPSIQSLPDEDLVEIFRAKDLIKKVNDYMDAVKAELEARLQSRPIEGVKFAKGRGSRVWNDPFHAAEVLSSMGVEPWKTEIISPFAAELKLKELQISKKDIEDLISSVDGKPTLKLVNNE